ncbi:MAG: endo-1,4-beta-xylanase [Phycisphaerales bacterium]|jgi:hypothetical protein|nr:endo-1,4-beta-xylanase [Phycisphaerales bacterium]
MLRFVIDQGGPAGPTRLAHAHAFAADDLPVQADVRFENGEIVIASSSPEPLGLSLQHPVARVDDSGEPIAGPPDLLTLQTCLLPPRAGAYGLALELARHRIMLVLNKLEDWQIADLSPDHPAMVMFERARAAFTDALTRSRHAEERGVLAHRALAFGLASSELLAQAAAERDAETRASGSGYEHAVARYRAIRESDPPPKAPILLPGALGVVLPGRAAIGATADEPEISEPVRLAVAKSSDFIGLPMRWIDLEPTEGAYSFARTDAWIEWAVRKARMPIVAGPVIDLRPSSVPEWLYIWENDYDTLREMVYEHLRQIVTRYRRTVQTWTVCSGLHTSSNFRMNFDQIMDLTRICVLVVRKLHPQARVQVEVVQPWGEYHALSRHSLPPVAYLEMCQQAQLPIDVIALRVQTGQPEPGQGARDPAALAAMLDRYAQLEKPIALSILGAPSAPSPHEAHDQPESPAARLAPGRWRSGWTPDSQARWAQEVGRIAATRPYVISLCWQQVRDHPGDAGEMPYGGLIDASGAPKPALAAWASLRTLGAARTPAGTTTGA